MRFLPFLALFLFAVSPAHAAEIKGLWEFGNSANLGKATIGTDLTIRGASPAWSATSTDGSATTLQGVITTIQGPANYLLATHNIGANGGGAKTNQYSMVFDVMRPAGNLWRSFYQTNLSNSGDAEFFVRGSGGTLNSIGRATIDYSSGALPQNKWQRIVISVDLGGSFRSYVNGSLFGTHLAMATDNSDYSLHPSQVLLFADNDGENNPLVIGTAAVFSGSLTAAEVAALGGPGTPLIENDVPPTITEGAFHYLVMEPGGGPITTTFHATDIDGDPVTWSIPTPPALGSATIVSQSSAACTVTFTPAPGQTTATGFKVRASDVDGHTDIAVQVTALQTPTDPRTFYEENFDSAVLVPEATTGTQRRMPPGNQTPVWNTPADSGLGLTSGPDRFLHPPYSRIIEFEGFNMARTDFWRNGDDQGRSTAFAPGTNVVAVADSDEFADGGAASVPGELNVFLRTPPFRIPAAADVAVMQLSFLSSFRQEGGETSRVLVYHNGSNTPAAILPVPNNGSAPAGLVTFSWEKLGSPAAGTTLLIEFAHENASNHWWWAIDDIFVGIPNRAPVIGEGSLIATTAPMAVATDITFTATDADEDPITWSITTPPTHGTATVTAQSSGTCTITYTSDVGFSGMDSLEVAASDGRAATPVTVEISVTNTPPVIAGGDIYQFAALMDGGPREANFTATDANNNPLTWSIGSQAGHGIATIATQTSGAATVSYTPAAGYAGVDSFVVEVSDGLATDTVTVRVNVADPTADPILTVVSQFGNPSPAAGPHSNPLGTLVNASAADVVTADARHTLVGWTMTGDGPATGDGNSFSFNLNRDSTLTWVWKTERLITTTVTGNGTVSVATGWHDASHPLQITATAAPGHHFTGWAGDIAGATRGGKSIVLPMDRAYGTITATFAPEENFTIIALPDTQNYTSISSPTDTFTRQAQWVLDNKETLNIRFLTHLGDIVNAPTATSQWTRATAAMNLLNQQLAYGTCPGNHDLGSNDEPNSSTPSDYLIRFGPNPTHASSVGRWIDPATSQVYDWYQGSSPRGYSSYQIVPIGGRDFLFLHLDHDCPDEDMAWAASVLSAHPRTLTMITTHNYLAESGDNGRFGTGTGERGYTAQPNVSMGPDRNRPQEVFNALVKPFNQVYMVICGHMFATYRLEKTNRAGKTVHEVVCNYQSLPNGGNGFLRIMDFRPAENRILNTTYSPTLGRYVNPAIPADSAGMLDLHDPNGGEFQLDLDFDGRFDTTLTIASAYPDVSPALGAHLFADGSPVAATAAVRTHGTTREVPVAWTLAGAQTLSGNGNQATFNHQGDTTLTWIWQTERYLETTTTGAGIVSIPSGWQTDGAEVSITAQPDAGAAFLSWTGDITGCAINGTRITVPMDRARGPITANFGEAPPMFAVTVASAHPGVTPSPGTHFFAQGSQVTFSAANFAAGGTRATPVGYSLAGALTSSGAENSVNLTITGDFTITWDWQTEYQVVAAANGPGTVSPEEMWVASGGPLVLTATPGPAATLVSWTGDIAAGNAVGNTFNLPAVTRPIGPIIVTFATDVYTLTVVSAHNSVTPAPGPFVVPHGTTVAFSALPMVIGRTRHVPTGWVIAGPSPDSGTTAQGSVTLNGDATLTWSWAPEVYLELASGLEGRIQPMDAAGWKVIGSQTGLTGVVSQGYSFVRWTGDVPPQSTSTSLALTMDQPRLVAADFTPAATVAGTPHWWLDAHTNVVGGNYEAADLTDADGDGQTAREEFLAGTSDRDPHRRFQVLSVKRIGGPELRLTWQSDLHRNYTVRANTDLSGNFTEILAPVSGEWPETSALIPLGPEPRRFFQLAADLTPGGPLDADSLALSPPPAAGSVVREMRRIPAGWFTMGENAAQPTSAPSHPAWVAGFMMDRFEVTRGDWESVATWAASRGYDIPTTLPVQVPANHPVVGVTWYNAVKWCNARSEMEGRIPAYRTDATGTNIYRTGALDLTAAAVNWSGNGYRLPTEAEWERASRGGLAGQPYPWGNADALLRANHWDYALESGTAPNAPFPYTTAVGSFGSENENSYGLADMTGNAWEWTWNRMRDYSADPQIAPRGPDQGAVRVLRGGSWQNSIDQATNAQRLARPPAVNDTQGTIGFRTVRGLHPNE